MSPHKHNQPRGETSDGQPLQVGRRHGIAISLASFRRRVHGTLNAATVPLRHLELLSTYLQSGICDWSIGSNTSIDAASEALSNTNVRRPTIRKSLCDTRVAFPQKFAEGTTLVSLADVSNIAGLLQPHGGLQSSTEEGNEDRPTHYCGIIETGNDS
jgi:hypothetical protein